MLEPKPGSRRVGAKDLTKIRKGPLGKNLCRWCDTEVTGRRINWCSKKCVDEYRAATDPVLIRKAVFERDQGLCQICQIECLAVQKQIDNFIRNRPDWHIDEQVWLYRDWCKQVPLLNAQYGLRIKYTNVRDVHVYEIDHIVPVIEGGSSAMNNLRTLCMRCHKAESAALAKRRAQKRREEKKIAEKQ